MWKRWNAAGTTTTTTTEREKDDNSGVEKREEVSQRVGMGGIFRQLMDDVGSGGKETGGEKGKKKWLG